MGCASSAPRVGPPVGADGLPTEEADEFRPRKRSFLEPEFIRSRAPSELLDFLTDGDSWVRGLAR